MFPPLFLPLAGWEQPPRRHVASHAPRGAPVTRPRYSAQTLAVLARAMAPEDAAVFLASNRAKDPHAVASGRAADAAGRALETYLNGQHAAALKAGLANIRKVGAPVLVNGDGKPYEWAGRGPADYVGALRGGRAVAVEAKSTEGRFSRREVPQHQQDDLSHTADLGGLALLVLELRDAGAIYAVEWSRVPWRVTKAVVGGRVQTRETVGADELAGCEVPAKGIYLGRWC